MSDLTEVLRSISRIEQRVSNLIRSCVVAEIQSSPPRVKVEYDIDENQQPVKSGWLCYFEERQGHVQHWNPPKIGEQGIIVSPCGDLRLGKVILGLNTTENPPISTDLNINKMQFSDGTFFEYNRTSKVWSVNFAGSATFTSPLFKFVGPVVFEGDVTQTGNYTLTGGFNQIGDYTLIGSLIASQEITAASINDATGSMILIRMTYNGHAHPDLKLPVPQMA